MNRTTVLAIFALVVVGYAHAQTFPSLPNAFTATVSGFAAFNGMKEPMTGAMAFDGANQRVHATAQIPSIGVSSDVLQTCFDNQGVSVMNICFGGSCQCQVLASEAVCNATDINNIRKLPWTYLGKTDFHGRTCDNFVVVVGSSRIDAYFVAGTATPAGVAIADQIEYKFDSFTIVQPDPSNWNVPCTSTNKMARSVAGSSNAMSALSAIMMPFH